MSNGIPKHIKIHKLIDRFHAFFHNLDNHRTDYFLWVTASGIPAATQSKAVSRTDDLSEDELDVNGEEG